MMWKYYGLLLVSTLLNVGAQVSLKLNSKTTSTIDTVIWKPFFWLAIVLYGVSFLLYAFILSKLELSRAYPISSMALIMLIIIVSAVFFGESLTTYKIVGMVLSIISIVLLFK